MSQRRGASARRPGDLGRGGRARPASRPGVPTGARAGQALRRTGAEVAALRSRLTGRAAVLVLVVSALLVSYASSLRAHLDQRGQIAALEQSIADSEREIAALKREKSRWDDPAYVEAQARARFAFGFPGEVGYQVLDDDGSPLDAGSSLDQPPPETGDGRPEWWESTLASLDAAERPPREEPSADGVIKAPKDDALTDGEDG
jgi:cell division protein FtsB